MAKTIDKTIMTIQLTGLFNTTPALAAWNVLLVEDQDWPNMKAHFTNAYEVWLISGSDMRSIFKSWCLC